MAESVVFNGGRLLPGWIKYLGTAFGVLFAGFGISRIVVGDVKTSFAPLAAGFIAIYTAGYDRRFVIDDTGVTKTTSFWDWRRNTSVGWSDVRLVTKLPGRGTRFYFRVETADSRKVLMEFKKDQADDVMEILENHLDTGRFAAAEN
jgi:hypothetical protein